MFTVKAWPALFTRVAGTAFTCSVAMVDNGAAARQRLLDPLRRRIHEKAEVGSYVRSLHQLGKR